MLNKHQPIIKPDNISNPFPCFDCTWKGSSQNASTRFNDTSSGNNKLQLSYSSSKDYVAHLINVHNADKKEPLQGMYRRTVATKASSNIAVSL